MPTLSRLYVGGKAARDELWTAAEGFGILKCKQVERRACICRGAHVNMHVRKNMAGRVAREN